MIKHLQTVFDGIMDMRVTGLYLKSKQDFIKDLTAFMRLNRNLFDKHFTKDIKTSKNPIYKIDSLIWSTVLFEKVDRYSPLVYRMGEYLLKNYQFVQKLDFEDLVRCNLEFDIFRMSMDFQQRITEVNPQLTPEEFEAELDSEEPIKKFFYTYDDPDFKMPIDIEKKNVIDHRLDEVVLKFGRILNKYHTHDTYDHFEEVEETERELKKREKKYVWKAKGLKDGDIKLLVANDEIARVRGLSREIAEIAAAEGDQDAAIGGKSEGVSA